MSQRTHPADRAPETADWLYSMAGHLVLVVIALLFGARGQQGYELPPIPEHVAVSMVALPRPANQLPNKVMIRPPDPNPTGKVPVETRPELPPPQEDVPQEAETLPEATPPPAHEAPKPTPPSLNRKDKREELLAMVRSGLQGPETHLPDDPDGTASEEDVLQAGATGPFNAKMSAYQRRVRDRIQEFWHPLERLVKEQPDLTVVIELHIDNAGTILSPAVLRSSGNPSFDASALRAVERAATLPLPPEDLQEQAQKGFVVSFRAHEAL